MLGGLTTFVTMAYVVVVNPQILAQAGRPRRRGLCDLHLGRRGHARDGELKFMQVGESSKINGGRQDWRAIAIAALLKKLQLELQQSAGCDDPLA